jgi:hypothetical protein
VLRSYGMMIFGPLQNLEHRATFDLLRGISLAEEKERMRAAFYASDAFPYEIEPVLDLLAAPTWQWSHEGLCNFCP